LDLAHEEALAADGGERLLGLAIALGLDGHQLDLERRIALAEPARHPLGLGERELALARGDAELHVGSPLCECGGRSRRKGENRRAPSAGSASPRSLDSSPSSSKRRTVAATSSGLPSAPTPFSSRTGACS